MEPRPSALAGNIAFAFTRGRKRNRSNGVRRSGDFGTENYNRMRTVIADLWDYSQNSARWTTFRVGTEGHNILRFDNARQNITGRAEIRALPTEAGIYDAVVDLSSLCRD